MTVHFSFLTLDASLQVALFYEDGRPVDGKGVGRKVLDRVRDTYESELGGKEFAYDGEKSLFTVGSLPRNKLEFTVVLEDVTSSRCVWYHLFQFFTVVLLSLCFLHLVWLHSETTMEMPAQETQALMTVIGKG